MKTETIEKARFNVFNLPVQSGTCSAHGDFDSINVAGEVWSGCPTCADEKEASERKARSEKAWADEELRQERDRRSEWEGKLKRCGIPERQDTQSVRDLQPEDQMGGISAEGRCARGRLDSHRPLCTRPPR